MTWNIHVVFTRCLRVRVMSYDCVPVASLLFMARSYQLLMMQSVEHIVSHISLTSSANHAGLRESLGTSCSQSYHFVARVFVFGAQPAVWPWCPAFCCFLWGWSSTVFLRIACLQAAVNYALDTICTNQSTAPSMTAVVHW